jgi:hypothetical protein
MKIKKLVIVLITGFLVGASNGCGNSPDGDGQKPVDGAYGRMSNSYGPAGDGKSRRMSNIDPNIDPSARRMRSTKQKKPGSAPKPMDPDEVIAASQPRKRNTNPSIDPGKRTMENK